MDLTGKSVNRFGEPVTYPTGPLSLVNRELTDRHSFYQLLHQGTDIVPLQFIGFKNNQLETDVTIQDSTSQQKLCANVAAQIVAFAQEVRQRTLTRTLRAEDLQALLSETKLTPKTLGALLAHFENKIMFQGFVWNTVLANQEGVQLGKVLAKKVLAHDDALKVYSDLLNI